MFDTIGTIHNVNLDQARGVESACTINSLHDAALHRIPAIIIQPALQETSILVDLKNNSSEPSVRKRGRPRANGARIAILKAAYDLLEEGGISSFTIEGVAARSGSAKSTIYRWWPSRESLAVAAFLAVALPRIAFRNTGCAADDIKTQMQRVARVYRGSTGRVVRDLIAAGISNAAAAEAFVNGYVQQRREAVREVLLRGIASGEFDENLDVESAIDMLYGPMFYRLLVGHGSIDPQFIANTADVVLAGFSKRERSVAKSSSQEQVNTYD